MTASVLLACLMLGGVSALVDLNCSDNATCIDHLGRDLVQSLRERKAVRLFELLTIEPLQRRQGRSSRGIWGMMEDHALSFDWGDYTFRISVPQDGRDDALDLELYESRAVKEEPDPSPKKSSSKVEEEQSEEEILPKRGIRRRRRQKKKVMQALIPLMFGMKSAGVVIFVFGLVTVLTLKAFMASKVALLVTAGMAAKKLYESYSTGAGFQNHPYLYSQYPIDFPSASSHAYSVSGVSPQFASNDMYNPNMLEANAQEFLQQQDASAQQSQQAPLLVNSTHAAERWDGKSTLRKLFEPIVDSLKTVINPIANMFYGAMPTFRGLNTEISAEDAVQDNPVEEPVVKKPKEILVPQPRFIAQRKNFVKTSNRPKKHIELKVDLDRLKSNKDFLDYIKTKKYKFNYPNTSFYPRVKYVINPNLYYNMKPNNSRLLPYRKMPSSGQLLTTTTTSTTASPILAKPSDADDWKPIVILNSTTTPQNITTQRKPPKKKKPFNFSIGNTKRIIRRYFQSRPNLKSRKRAKRDLTFANDRKLPSVSRNHVVVSILDILTDVLSSKTKLIDSADKTPQSIYLPKGHPPLYYSLAYDALMMTLDVIEGIYSVHEFIFDYYSQFAQKIKKIQKRGKRKSKPKDSSEIKIDKNTENVESQDNPIIKLTQDEKPQNKISTEGSQKDVEDNTTTTAAISVS